MKGPSGLQRPWSLAAHSSPGLPCPGGGGGAWGFAACCVFSSSSSGLQMDRLAAHWLSQSPRQCRFPCLCKATIYGLQIVAVTGNQRIVVPPLPSHKEEYFPALSAEFFRHANAGVQLSLQFYCCLPPGKFPHAPLHIAGAARGCDPLWVPSPYLAGGFVDTQAVQERRAARHAVQGTQRRTGGCDVLVAAFLAGCQKLSRAGQRG